jgi:hypothetical protein
VYDDSLARVPESMMNANVYKDESITRMLDELRAELGDGAFDIVDHWDTDSFATGIARPDNHRVLVYVSTHHLRNNKYWVSLELPPEAGDDAPYATAGERRAQGIQELASIVRAHFGTQTER